MEQRGIQVTHWRRYGKDRLYVNDADGQRLGGKDLLTGEITVEIPTQRDAVLSALSADQPDAEPQREDQEGAPAESAVAVTASPAAPTEEWQDLATHVPGQLAREKADQELAAMRGRSRVGTFIARTFDWKTEERAWRVGAGGEETVGAKLEKLVSRGWFVLHSVPVGRGESDIDHVLIGPGGVYTVNTKNHPGKKVWVGARQIRVDGHPVPYLRNSRHEAERAGRLLSAAVGCPVVVRPVLVILTGTLIPNITIRQRPDDVTILDRMDIPGAFTRAPQRLSKNEIEALFEQARRSSTWHD